MEQETIKQGLNIMEQWGPSAIIIFLGAIIQVIYAWNVKKNAVDPTKEQATQILEHADSLKIIRERQHKNVEDIAIMKVYFERTLADFRVELERRVTFHWLEDKLLPKIDDIVTRVTRIEQQLKKRGE